MASLFTLLDDAFKSADVKELKDRLTIALSQLEEIESTYLPTNLIGCSVKELLLLEKTMSVFTKHGITLEMEGLLEQPLPASCRC